MITKISINDTEKYLKDVLPEIRYEHTLRVGLLAKELAERYKIDPEKAYLTGILHDVAKKREDELLKKYDISSFIPDEDLDKYFPILHSALGAMEAKEIFEIQDQDILDAICYHTTGRPGMGTLEKIVYIADSCEPNRKGNFVNEIRKIAFENLDLAVLKLMDFSLEICIERNRVIHPLTVEARNYYLQKGVDFE